jgi:hypothetical protein
VKEKFFVKSYDTRLNVSPCQKGTGQQFDSSCRCSAEVSSLADMASCFVLRFFVRVRQGLGKQ